MRRQKGAGLKCESAKCENAKMTTFKMRNFQIAKTSAKLSLKCENEKLRKSV